MAAGWRFWIDRGGTFTDCLGIDPEGIVYTEKILSSDLAPIEAVEAILARAGISPAAFANGAGAEIRLGTTVATNALLERRGVPTALCTPMGLAGVFAIGTQERPSLFALEIERPSPLHLFSVEGLGRCDAAGERVADTDFAALREGLEAARRGGAEALAIVGLHGFAHSEDEQAAAEWARTLGFSHVVCSHELSREIGFLARGETAIADAYLTPLLRGHTEALTAAWPDARLRMMQSSGGLTEPHRFRGPNALLSGPAGGVVAAASVAAQAGHDRAIGFDMGGTSTDVSLIERRGLDRAFESEVGGVRVKAPMLRIHTVAAGGGSICRFDGIKLTVGPESAGSEPGPLCYAKQDEAGRPLASELCITDINLALGRVVADRFPFPLEEAPVQRALEEMGERLAAAGFERTAESLAAGFFEIANASMAQAILEVCARRGADPRDHVLVGFGGAGGQHVCAIATRLGLSEILLHPYAGLLSAYGIGIARTAWDGERDGGDRVLPDRGALPDSMQQEWAALESEAEAALAEDGGEAAPVPEPGEPAAAGEVRIERSLDLGYEGTDTALNIPEPTAAIAAVGRAGEAEAWRAAFEAVHQERFGYLRPGRVIALSALRLRAERVGDASPLGVAPAGRASSAPPTPLRRQSAWFPERGRVSVPVYARESLSPGHRLEGPALILEATGTVVLDPGFSLEVDGDQVFRMRRDQTVSRRERADLAVADPVRLEVLGNRFMSIAEQMGTALRNTSVSTNIKERLDYSCAIFDEQGGLVANAPHIPVHLGAMADTVSAIRSHFAPFAPGDVYVTNDPYDGGSHLPDVTVVTPVFFEADRETANAVPRFYVASRGHHADIGGKTPGSMPADSQTLAEEGVLIEPFALVRDGRFQEEALRNVLSGGNYPARRPDDNVADLEAKVAANQAGARLLEELVAEVGEEVVRVTMHQLQQAAARKVGLELAKVEPGVHRFKDRLDDGTAIHVRLEVEHATPAALQAGALPARMKIDFEGSGPASTGNLNAPSAVVRAAVIYVLRSLVAERIPLNGGCLEPVEIVIPSPSILDPPRGAAVVGGNVETSQRVVDVLLGALGRAAASQGTMNNVTFGDDHFGYYETIGGGAGATAAAAGASGVHTHMTNTRITDPEVLEARFPVQLLHFGVREGSGGAGLHEGGEGTVRAYRFLRPVTVSLLTERRRAAPFGLAGGGDGARGRNRVRRCGEADFEAVDGRATLSLAAGDELWIETPGGGGFGASANEPSKRKPT